LYWPTFYLLSGMIVGAGGNTFVLVIKHFS